MRNLLDRFKEWSTEEVAKEVQATAFPYAIAVQNIQGDFNLGTVIRNANVFGAKEVIYFDGKRKFDPRGCVGAQYYSNVRYYETFGQVLSLKEQYTFVAIENNINRPCQFLHEFKWPKNPLIFLGQEGQGLTKEVLDNCEHYVSIKQFGSIRSLNLGTASGIVMYDLVNKWKF